MLSRGCGRPILNKTLPESAASRRGSSLPASALITKSTERLQDTVGASGGGGGGRFSGPGSGVGPPSPPDDRPLGT